MVRSTCAPVAELFKPMIMSPSQWPGAARPEASAGRATLVLPARVMDVPLQGAWPELAQVSDNLAASYPRQSGISVTEITYLLGFTDVSNFTRAFKRWTGMSPTQFREQA